MTGGKALRDSRVLLTGGAGFLGSNLYSQLKAQNEVTIIDIVEPHFKLEKGDNFLRGDVTARTTFEKVRGDYDVIFHMASDPSVISFRSDPGYIAARSIQGFVNVLECGRRAHCRTFVFPSSGTVYDPRAQSAQSVVRPTNIYGATKVAFETIAATYQDHFSVVALRIFMGYGPGEEKKRDLASPVSHFLVSVLARESPRIWGDGRQTRDLVFVGDICEALIRAPSLNGRFNAIDVGTGIETSFLDVLGIIRDVSGLRIEPTFVLAPPDYIRAMHASPEDFVSLIGRAPTPVRHGIELFYTYLASRPRTK